MLSWSARCGHCGKQVEDWSDAGLLERRWLHKACWSEIARSSDRPGRELPALRPPTERTNELELPMLVFLLMFHFGLATAVAGWLMLTRDFVTAGVITLVIGLVTPLVGGAGIALNIVSRRQIELIRRELEAAGGWRASR
jgi:hypothetical protein